MERLQEADREAGVEETPLTARQKEAIAEVRRIADSRLAQGQILSRDALSKVYGEEERAKAEQEYQVDRRRIEEDRDREIEKIRRQGK